MWAVRVRRGRRIPTPNPGTGPASGRRDLDDVSARLVTTATALLNWHDSARFSAVDGSPTKPIKSGWSRVDPVTGHEEFPRIDPAMICLVHDGHDRAVLARQTAWPERLFSLLAGFVEAGESFETCVMREIAEEVGLDVTDVRYLGSQPWPFPRSVMMGFHAIGDPERSSRSATARSPRRVVHPGRGAGGPRRGRLDSDSPSRLLLPARSRLPGRSSSRGPRLRARRGATERACLDLAELGLVASSRRRTSRSAPRGCRR